MVCRWASIAPVLCEECGKYVRSCTYDPTHVLTKVASRWAIDVADLELFRAMVLRAVVLGLGLG